MSTCIPRLKCHFIFIFFFRKTFYHQSAVLRLLHTGRHTVESTITGYGRIVWTIASLSSKELNIL